MKPLEVPDMRHVIACLERDYGVSMREIARRTGVPVSTISRTARTGSCTWKAGFRLYAMYCARPQQ